jgi:hypothetical protein
MIRSQPESELQTGCVRWFRLQYPHLAMLLFAVPNGGNRNAREAGRMKDEGVVPGVSDLILLVPNSHHAALCIEMKAGKNAQTELQKKFQASVENMGSKYVICRTVHEFVKAVNEHLSA